MNIFRLLTSGKARTAYRYKRFMSAKPRYSNLIGDFSGAVIASVAFNRPDVMEWQIYLVRRHMAEREGYIVFDNSSDMSKRREIQELCQREQISYVSLPNNSLKSGHSHAAALNWITKNFIAEHRPKLFGFIDHDIFPLTAVSLTEKIGQAKTYGSRMDVGGAWYMWPGFCFFSGVPTAKLDFNLVPHSSHGFMDTGGASWETLYQHLSPADVRSVRVIPVDDREKAFEMIDGWLHAQNASGHATWVTNREAELETWLRGASGEDCPRVTLGRI
jgi:hypothetical protein